MLAELLTTPTALDIRLFTVNEAGEGYEAAVPTMGDLGTMPILQDTVEADVWNRFDTEYRDVLILDENNERVATFNLTGQDLHEAANYEALRTLLIDTAGGLVDDGTSGEPDGAVLYDAYCAMCHGDTGQGYLADDANALSNESFLATATDDFLAAGIIHGRAGTPMSAWGRDQGGPLSDEQVDAIVDHLRTWQQGDSLDVHADIVTGDATAGAALYDQHCAVCHAPDGSGETGPSVSDPWLLATASDGFLRHAIADGRPGTAMAGYGNILTDTDIDDLVALLRSWEVPVNDTPAPSWVETYDSVVLHADGTAATFTLTEDRFVAADDVHAAIDAGQRVVVLDARPTSDYLAGHITGAVSVPFYDVEAAAEHLPDDTWIVTYCGCPHALSGEAFDALAALGYTNIAVLDEGYYVWAERGYPTTVGPPTQD